jgi:hypothetical protein
MILRRSEQSPGYNAADEVREARAFNPAALPEINLAGSFASASLRSG